MQFAFPCCYFRSPLVFSQQIDFHSTLLLALQTSRSTIDSPELFFSLAKRRGERKVKEQTKEGQCENIRERVGGEEDDRRGQTGSAVTSRALTFSCVNEGLLIRRTLTFQHFTPHKAPGCTKPHSDGEMRARLVRPLRHVNLLGLQRFAHWKGNGCDTRFCIDPCIEGPAFLSIHTEVRVSCRTCLQLTRMQLKDTRAEGGCLLIH